MLRGGAPPPLAEPGWPTLPAAQYQHTIVASWLTCAACAAAASGQGAEMVGQAPWTVRCAVNILEPLISASGAGAEPAARRIVQREWVLQLASMPLDDSVNAPIDALMRRCQLERRKMAGGGNSLGRLAGGP